MILLIVKCKIKDHKMARMGEVYALDLSFTMIRGDGEIIFDGNRIYAFLFRIENDRTPNLLGGLEFDNVNRIFDDWELIEKPQYYYPDNLTKEYDSLLYAKIIQKYRNTIIENILT